MSPAARSAPRQPEIVTPGISAPATSRASADTTQPTNTRSGRMRGRLTPRSASDQGVHDLGAGRAADVLDRDAVVRELVDDGLDARGSRAGCQPVLPDVQPPRVGVRRAPAAGALDDLAP